MGAHPKELHFCDGLNIKQMTSGIAFYTCTAGSLYIHAVYNTVHCGLKYDSSFGIGENSASFLLDRTQIEQLFVLTSCI